MWTTRETLSHLTRVRESKCDSEYKSICDKGRTPRGCVNRNLVANAICVDEPPLSHPARVRESKSGKCDYFGNPNVAPHAGARIKTPRGFLSLCVRWVAPCTGARIEITIKKPLWQKSHPNVGVGIEMEMHWNDVRKSVLRDMICPP